MKHFCPTIVIRHRKERLKKCSLRGLEEREDFCFYTYPLTMHPPVEGYVLLSADAPDILSAADAERGILLLDATWKLAGKMEKTLNFSNSVIRRALPSQFKTAYPRRQDEPHGLASIEALYIAYVLTGRNPEGLLDNYHWKELFLEINLPCPIVEP